MSELADLLELLHGAGQRWRTARLVVRQWGDSDLAVLAMRRHGARLERAGRTAFATARGERDGDSEWESLSRAWIDPRHDRSRVEGSGYLGDRLTVRTGGLWWSYSAQTGSLSNESDPDLGIGNGYEFDTMLEPSPLLPAFDFTVSGTARVAGRDAVVVIAAPRSEDARRGYGAFFAHGADEVVLAVDRERGVVLRAESRLDGSPFALHEIVEAAFDEPFSDGLFRFASPDGSTVRSPRETFGHPEAVSVEEAARRASFTVLVPARLPRGWTVDTSYMAPGGRPARNESATIRVLDGADLRPRMRIMQGRDPIPDSLAWQAVEHGGRTIEIFTHGGPGGTCEAKMELHGTHVRASGTVEREAFLDVLASLVPAPTELPPMVTVGAEPMTTTAERPPFRASIAPWLSVANGSAAVDWHKAAFGAAELERLEDGSGGVAVARLSIGGADFWLQEDPESAPDAVGRRSVRMIVTVEDPDAVFAQVVAAGATEIAPVADGHGWRVGRIADPFGHHWEIGKPLTEG